MSVHELMQLATGYWRAAALSAAVELELFAALEPDGATAALVAERGESDPAYTADLLNALVGLGLLVRDDGRYAIAPAYRELLSPDGERCMLGALGYNAQLYPLWGRLAQCVRDGAPAVPPSAHLGDDPAATRGFVMGMHSRALGLGPTILPAIDAAGRRLLDIGSGPGTFSRILAERRSDLRVTQLDLPAVVDVARELAANSPAADRIDFLPADYHTDPLPAGYDALLYCGALHQETDAAAAALFERFAAALAPGGVCEVIDLMTEPGGATPAFSALFGLNMKLFNPAAGVFAADRVAELLRAAGFERVSVTRLDESPYYHVRGHR